MSEDKSNWRDRVKSPSEKMEKFIGGENTLPKKEGNVINTKEIVEEGENRKIKPQEFDEKLNAEKTREAKIEKEKRAVKDYENRVTKPNVPDTQKSNIKLIDKIDDIVDKVGQGLKKAAPYLGDAARVIGKATVIPGVAVEIFYPESTATDEEMGIYNKEGQENEHKDIISEPSQEKEATENQEIIRLYNRKNQNDVSHLEDLIEQPDNEIGRSPEKEQSFELSEEEYSEIVNLRQLGRENEPSIDVSHLELEEEIEPEIQPEETLPEIEPNEFEEIEEEYREKLVMDMPEPGMDDGDDGSDGSDGGDGGDGGGSGE